MQDKQMFGIRISWFMRFKVKSGSIYYMTTIFISFTMIYELNVGKIKETQSAN